VKAVRRLRFGFSSMSPMYHFVSPRSGNSRTVDVMIFLTGRRITGEEALAWGLADILVGSERLRASASELAAEIAENAPLAVVSTRATVRRGLAEAVKAQTDIEFVEQDWLMRTEDHREGIKAVAERRPGKFSGK
jgi:enoyl-CoA hydratase/carnithine racemase